MSKKTFLTSRRVVRRAALTVLESLEGRRLLSAGDLDPTFGSGGIVTTDFPGSTDDIATASIRLNSGKLLVVGSSDGRGVMARYDADGSRDTSFGTGGVVAFGDSVLTAAASVIEDGSGGIIVGGARGEEGVIARYTAGGALDTSFGSGGTSSDGLADTTVNGLTLAGGGIVGLVSGTGDFTAVKFSNAGDLDTNFGGGVGYANFDSGYGDDTANTISTHDGSILLAGVASQPNSGAAGDTGQDAAFVQFDTGGLLDPSFNGSGVQILPGQTTGSATINALDVLSGGEILGAGTNFNGNFFVTRLLDDGTLDGSFGAGMGFAVTSAGGSGEQAHAIGTDSDGHILLIGNSDQNVAVVRLSADGANDDGYNPATLGHSVAFGDALVSGGLVNDDGSVRIVGSQIGANGDNDFAQYEVTSDAMLDSGFGDGGTSLDALTGPKPDAAFATAQQGDGKLVVAGSTDTSSGKQIALSRYLANGTLDTSFGGDGRVTLSVGDSAEAHGVAISSTGEIYVAFTSTSGGEDDFGVAAFTSDGTLDSGFAGGSVVISTPGESNDVAGIALSPDQSRIYIGGTESTQDDSNFELAAVSTGGSVLSDVTVDFGSSPSTPTADSLGGIAVQTDGNIVLGGTASDGTTIEFALTRLMPNGSIDPSFGKVMTADGGVAAGGAVALDGNGNIYVAGFTTAAGPNLDASVIKFDSSGNRVTSGFGDAGANGIAHVTIEDGAVATSIAIAPSGKILVAGTASNDAGGEDFGVARFNSDGSVDSTFDASGVAVASIGSTAEVGGMLIQSDGNIVVTGTDDSGDFATARFDGTGDVAANPPPVANAGADVDVNEGGTVHFDGTASTGTGLTYAWDLDGDGQFDDAFTATPTFTYADGDATITASLQVTDSNNQTSVDSLVVHIHNVAPTASVSGPGSLMPGQSGTFTLGASDPSPVDQAANFTFQIDWDGNGTIDQTVVGPSGITVNHSYSSTGGDTVKVTAVDKDGGASAAPATVAVSVAAPSTVNAQLVSDPQNDGQMMLLVNGTDNADTIDLTVKNKTNVVSVSVSGVVIGSYTNPSRVVIFANGGDDLVTHGGGFKRAFEEYGGAGNDTLKAGSNGDILVGGSGDDSLVSGQGNDLLIGGTGADKLAAGGGEDLLIAGTTSFDDNSAALNAISAEWTSTRSFNSRIDNLIGNNPNTADFAARLNGNFFLLADVSNATVFDDGAKDTANGGDGSDWFFVNSSGGVIDKINGAGSDAVVQDIS